MSNHQPRPRFDKRYEQLARTTGEVPADHMLLVMWECGSSTPSSCRSKMAKQGWTFKPLGPRLGYKAIPPNTTTEPTPTPKPEPAPEPAATTEPTSVAKQPTLPMIQPNVWETLDIMAGLRQLVIAIDALTAAVQANNEHVREIARQAEQIGSTLAHMTDDMPIMVMETN
mgnify:FL=1